MVYCPFQLCTSYYFCRDNSRQLAYSVFFVLRMNAQQIIEVLDDLSTISQVKSQEAKVQ